MDVNSLTVLWHDNNEPVYSIHFQPNKNGSTSERLATGGGDNNVRIWKIVEGSEESSKIKVEYLSTLARHTQAVNAVRFDPKGSMLATAGDDGTVLLWTLSETIVKEFGQDPDDELKESWVLKHACKSSSSEIYDLAWSPDSKYIITGSTDNISRIYDSHTGQQVSQIAEHNHYVQGVAWDPLGKYVATQSADRAVHIYLLNAKDQLAVQPTVYYKISRAELPTVFNSSESSSDAVSRSEIITINESPSASTSSSVPRSPSTIPTINAQVPTGLNFNSLKSSMLYHSENLESFFRRLTFSSDGSFLFTPSGIFKNSNSVDEQNKEGLTNTVYVYSRQGLNKPPVAHLPGFKKPVLAISFSPIFYEVDKSTKSAFDLPYKMIYAVATQDSVFIFDTQHEEALGSVSSIHYRILTDLSWNSDGNSLMISSTDGFCTFVTFKEGELGIKLKVDYKTLLSPDLELAETKAKVDPTGLVKKRPNDVLDFISKKGKLGTGGLIIIPSGPKRPEIADKDNVVKPKQSTIVIADEKNQAQVVHNPPVKQKKRISPILITENKQ